jgi:RNA polymerase sigma factor (sigma-70 family)
LRPLAGVAAISPEATDEHLVEAVKAGDADAFAVLFRRYRPEIARYAGRKLGDDGRAEDVVQETFLLALRGIRSLDRPSGFKAWLFRIAHNACIDQVRRRGRSEEVPFDADRLGPGDEIRLFRQAPSTHAALTQRQDMEHLRQAFVGLPVAQAEILILRELEGLSYEDIAARMGISRSAVESLLFRARRSLRAEFGEIATGERCRSMRLVMARAAEGMDHPREQDTLARHARDCTACRRDALVMGLGPLLGVERRTSMRMRLSRLAAFLPLPHFLQRRPVETAQASAGGGGSLASQAQLTFSNFSHVAAGGATVEHAATAIQKAAAVVTAAAVLGGGGIVANETRTTPVDPPVAAKRALAAPVLAQRQAGGVRLVTPLTAPLSATAAPPLVAVLSMPAALLTSLPLEIIPAVEPSPEEPPATAPEEPTAAEPPPAAPPAESPADTADPDPPAKEQKEEDPTGGASSAPADSEQAGTEFTSPDPNEPDGGIVSAGEPAPDVPADAPADSGGSGVTQLLECAPPAPAGCETTETTTAPSS